MRLLTPGLHFAQESLHLKVRHDLTSFDLIQTHLDVLAQALEFNPIQLVLITERIKRLGDKFIRAGKITRGDGRLDEISQFHGHIDSKLSHRSIIPVPILMVKILTKPKSDCLRTGDTFSGAPGTKNMNTKEIGDAVIAAL